MESAWNKKENEKETVREPGEGEQRRRGERERFLVNNSSLIIGFNDSNYLEKERKAILTVLKFAT